MLLFCQSCQYNTMTILSLLSFEPPETLTHRYAPHKGKPMVSLSDPFAYAQGVTPFLYGEE